MNRYNRKKIQDDEKVAIGETYKQYIETFQNQSTFNKTFIKADTLYAQKDDNANNKYGELYTSNKIIIKPKHVSAPPIKRPKKEKSNLKVLGEELKQLQNQRKTQIPKVPPAMNWMPDNDYLESTNLFVSNLSSGIRENDLIEIFGKYGPLGSVKIMWPREREKMANPNCGFVAYMSRKDAERALVALRNRTDMRINWGRSVSLPSYPIYIPPLLSKQMAPPPDNGQPFNAQSTTIYGDFDLYQSVVKVTIPCNRTVLAIIHRMVEFVIREGPLFEMLMINKESTNPYYNFLRDFRSPEHIYYRWKLFSILKGESRDNWSLAPFRMYKGGSIWIPPTVPNFKEGMPRELVEDDRVTLTHKQCKKFIKTLQQLDISRKSIANAMVYCLKHSDAIDDIINIILESLKDVQTSFMKKLARFYLLFDLFHNCKQKGIQLEFFDGDKNSLNVIEDMHFAYKRIRNFCDQDAFKSKVLTVLKCWMLRKYYPSLTITRLENVFLYGPETRSLCSY